MTDPTTDPTGPTGPTGPTPGGRPAVYSTRAKVAIVLVLALAAGAFVLAFQVARTGVEDEITRSGNAAPLDGFGLRPGRGAESVLRQTEIGIDLEPGWDATLVVDGQEIPTGELRRVPAENQVFFTPGEGKVVERLPGGPSCVTAIYWRTQVGRGPDDRQITWCFSVL